MTLVIAGAGGFGRETLDAVLATGAWHAVMFADDAKAGETLRGVHVVRPEEAGGHEFVVAVAEPSVRRSMVERLIERGLRPTTVVHPRSVIAAETTIGEGCIVLAHAYISSNVVLGRHVQVNYNATVGHDTVLDEFSTVYPGANVAGAARIGPGATIGSNACVLQGRTVGPDAVVGAGAVVTRNVSERAVVVGSPARPLERSRANVDDDLSTRGLNDPPR